MSKALRQQRILEIVAETPVQSQDALRRELHKTGLRVTQATLSRDVNELGLVKTQEGYAPATEEPPSTRVLPSLERLLREFVVDLRPAGNLLVLKTAPGSAQPVAAALDSESWPEILGTIGGDDTILIIAANNRNGGKVAARIREVIAP
jgi:transcriptional regulator of arginine metabolism